MVEAVETVFICVCIQNFILFLHCQLSCVDVNVGKLKTETDIKIVQAFMCRDSVDGVATYYRLDVLGFKSRQRQEISSSSSPSRPSLDPKHPSLQWAMAKHPVCGVHHPASSRAEVNA
jgi:hypothetical protein